MKYLEDKLEALDIYFAPKKESEKWVVYHCLSRICIPIALYRKFVQKK